MILIESSCIFFSYCNPTVVYAMDFAWALFMWNLYMDFVCDLYIYFEWSLFLFKEDKHASNPAMVTRINITQIASFDIHYVSNLAQRWKRMETKFWILIDCLWYGKWFTDASITTSQCWARSTGHFYAFTRRCYDIQGCIGCLNQPFWT